MGANSSREYHNPVMTGEVLSFLEPRSGGLYLDATLGGGGHAAAILEACSPAGRLIGIDRDSQALAASCERLEPWGERVEIHHGNFRHAREIIGESVFDGIVLDLGISSHQIDSAERGFSVDRDGPLDMRMNRESEASAAMLLGSLEEMELKEIFSRYGECRHSRRIARAIAGRREEKPLETTGELAALVRNAVPLRDERKSLMQVFQALRIVVNDELGALREGLNRLFDMLAPRGRMVVISYHSLEDRIVKTFFADLADPCICPPDLPVCACGGVPEVRVLTRKPKGPSAEEVERNPRSRSARLRAVERLER